MRYTGIFQAIEPRNLLKPDFETSVTYEPLEFFDAIFTVVLRGMSSVIYIGVFIYIGVSLKVER